MRVRTRITQIARERGFRVAEVARRLRLHRSNLSAMDAGRRSVSLRALARVGQFLGVSPSDLVEVVETPETPLFPSRALQQQLKQREQNLPDGQDRSWVHEVMLAWQRHYGASK